MRNAAILTSANCNTYFSVAYANFSAPNKLNLNFDSETSETLLDGLLK